MFVCTIHQKKREREEYNYGKKRNESMLHGQLYDSYRKKIDKKER